MHMIIRAIVYADSGEEALERAGIVFEKLVENGSFDYFTLFNDKKAVMSGEARWGRLKVCPLAESKDGKKSISQAMESTKDCFLRHLKEVRDYLHTYSDNELLDEGKNVWFRYTCRCLGEYVSPNVFLYDSDGEGILNKKHLRNALTKRPFKKVYVVPADVHY